MCVRACVRYSTIGGPWWSVCCDYISSSSSSKFTVCFVKSIKFGCQRISFDEFNIWTVFLLVFLGSLFDMVGDNSRIARAEWWAECLHAQQQRFIHPLFTFSWDHHNKNRWLSNPLTTVTAATGVKSDTCRKQMKYFTSNLFERPREMRLRKREEQKMGKKKEKQNYCNEFHLDDPKRRESIFGEIRQNM